MTTDPNTFEGILLAMLLSATLISMVIYFTIDVFVAMVNTSIKHKVKDTLILVLKLGRVIMIVFTIIFLLIGSMEHYNNTMIDTAGRITSVNATYVNLNDDENSELEYPKDINPTVGDIWEVQYYPGDKGIVYLNIIQSKNGVTGILIDRRDEFKEDE